MGGGEGFDTSSSEPGALESRLMLEQGCMEMKGGAGGDAADDVEPGQGKVQLCPRSMCSTAVVGAGLLDEDALVGLALLLAEHNL